MRWHDHFVVGGAASALTKLAIQPLDTAKTLVQAQALPERERRNAVAAVAATVKRHGPAALYRGLPATLVCVAQKRALPPCPAAAERRLAHG